MHPADVAELVAAEVTLLRERLAAAPQLGVTGVVLSGLDLDIGFGKDERPRIQGQVPSQLQGPGGQALSFVYEVPDLGRKERRALMLRLNCDDFDARPPTAELLLPDGNPLPAEQWPSDLSRQGVVHGHPDYPRPFFCRRGLHEYHTHPQHEDNPWDRHREALSLHHLVLELLGDLQTRWTLR
ncbi:MAG: hypothetical protein QOH12_3033 [Solirubrobacteraceae bacterium]|nr:hypothetical protein [Solirubrobacteraceae bacterium]